jgi:hypothetical protein
MTHEGLKRALYRSLDQPGRTQQRGAACGRGSGMAAQRPRQAVRLASEHRRRTAVPSVTAAQVDDLNGLGARLRWGILWPQRLITPIIFRIRQIAMHLMRSEATTNVNCAGRLIVRTNSKAAPVSDWLRMRQAIACPLNSMLAAVIHVIPHRN